MMLLERLVLYAVVLFLIMLVYTGQQHGTAGETLRDSVRKAAKFLWWTVVLVAGMEVCFWLFVD